MLTSFDIVICIVAIILVFIIFLLCREIVCWYFKINYGVELLEEIRDLMKKSK